MKLNIKLPATTANLGPGFDCLGAALSLYNEFEIKVVENKVKLKIEVEGIDCDLVAKNRTNLVYKAIKKIFDITKNKLPPLQIYIKNNIPLKRGLGSSATAIIAGVTAGNVLCGRPLSDNELLNIALKFEGHPDNIVPCMFGGLCVSNIIDGKIKFIKMNVPKDLCVLAIIPNKQISTKDARKILPEKINFKDAVKNIANVSMLISSIIKKNYDFLKFATEDFLHQPYRKKLIPALDTIFNVCFKNKALGCMLSGSGSTVIAMYKKKDLNTNLAQKITNILKKIFPLEYKILSFSNYGVKIKY